MRNIILIMSLSGTSILFVFCFVNLFAKKYVGIRCRQKIIRMVIIFYLIPFPLLKYLILSSLCKTLKLISGSKTVSNGLHYFPKNNDIIYKTETTVYLPMYQSIITGILLICALTVSIAVGIEIYRYIKIKQLIKKYSMPVQIDKDLKNIIMELKIHRNIKLYKSKYISQPMTTGIFSAVILLPDNRLLYNCSSIDSIMLHELTHIRYNDVFWHSLGILVMVMHWYNPFSYIANYFLNEIDEMHSDYLATSNLDKDRKLRYCTDLIAATTSKEINLPKTFACFMGASSKKQIKRRIDAIMKKNQRCRNVEVFIKAFSFTLALGIGFLYRTPTVIYANEQDIWVDNSVSEEIVIGKYIEMPNVIMPFDDYVVNQMGNVYEIPSEQSKVICNHSYEEGTRVTHKKNSKGGCSSKTYEASICIYCRKVITKDLIKTETYEKCPH